MIGRGICAGVLIAAVVSANPGARATGVSSDQTPAPSHPSLAGTWQLAPERGVGPARGPGFATPGGPPGRTATAGRGAGGAGGAGGGGGGGGSAPNWGEGGGSGELSPPSPEDLARVRTLGQMAQSPPPQLVIAEDAAQVSFTTDGSVRKVPVTNKKENFQSELGKVGRKARWKDAQLIIESDFEGNLRLSETYALSADGQELQLTYGLIGGRFPQQRVFHHFYTRAAQQ